MMVSALQVFSTRSTYPLQVQTLFSLNSFSLHQGCRLRNLQGWTGKGQVPTWDQEARKIPFQTLHLQKNPRKLMKPISYPSNIWSGPGIQNYDQSPRQKNLGNIFFKWTGTVSPGYQNSKREKYSHFHSQNTSIKRLKSNIWQNIMQSETKK